MNGISISPLSEGSLWSLPNQRGDQRLLTFSTTDLLGTHDLVGKEQLSRRSSRKRNLCLSLVSKNLMC
jgi:hypothetical protein